MKNDPEANLVIVKKRKNIYVIPKRWGLWVGPSRSTGGLDYKQNHVWVWLRSPVDREGPYLGVVDWNYSFIKFDTFVFALCIITYTEIQFYGNVMLLNRSC